MSDEPTGRASRVLAAVGGVWALAFATAHVYWSMGGRLGVPADAPPIGRRPFFLAYDVVSAIALVAAAAIAFVLAGSLVRGRYRTVLLWLTLAGAMVTLLRGGVGLVQDAVALATGGPSTIGMAYDVWFAVAGVMFLLVWRTMRRADRSHGDRDVDLPTSGRERVG